MKDYENKGHRRSNKVSHSLDEPLAGRLKDLAYSERVSESAIIEFVLSEFFALGCNETLGRIIRDNMLPQRRNQPPHAGAQPPTYQLLDDLQQARQRLSDAFGAWHESPVIETLNGIALARAEIVAILKQISHLQQHAESNST